MIDEGLLADLPWIIAGMTAVTYLPRLLPLILPSRRRSPRSSAEAGNPDGRRMPSGGTSQAAAYRRRLLALLPYTAIGALIVPAGFTAVAGRVPASVTGLVVAALAMRLTKQPFLAVVAAVGAVVAVQALLPPVLS